MYAYTKVHLKVQAAKYGGFLRELSTLVVDLVINDDIFNNLSTSSLMQGRREKDPAFGRSVWFAMMTRILFVVHGPHVNNSIFDIKYILVLFR